MGRCKHFRDSRKCNLLVKGMATAVFSHIYDSFKQQNPGKEMIPIGYCFWENEKMYGCPYFENGD